MGNQIIIAIRESDVDVIEAMGHESFINMIGLKMCKNSFDYEGGAFVSHYSHASDNAMYMIDGKNGFMLTNIWLSFGYVYNRSFQKPETTENILDKFKACYRSISDVSVRKMKHVNKQPESLKEKYHVFGVLTDLFNNIRDDEKWTADLIQACRNKDLLGHNRDLVHQTTYIGGQSINRAVTILMTGNTFNPILPFNTECGIKTKEVDSILVEECGGIQVINYKAMKKVSFNIINQMLNSYGSNATKK
jgi:hypothetical protein